jgi:DNA-binding CsgD family transcriptional regulator
VFGRANWLAARANFDGMLSPEEERLVQMFGEGLSTPQVASRIGQHRSMVWRKMLRLRAKLTEPTVRSASE